jgi:hypothetical protein
MFEFLAIALVGSVLLAAFVWLVIYRAMGNLIDWVILTFGNAEAVERLKRERGWINRP